MLRQVSGPASRGFTLVELTVVISLLGILFAIAAPSMSGYIINQKVRTAANSIQNGLQLARTEAVKRNQSVGFVLTAATPTTCSVTPSATGTNWVVRVEDCSITTPIQGKSKSEGTTNVTISVTDNSTAFANSIVFNGLGRLVTAPSTNNGIFIDVTSTNATRAMRIIVTGLGQIRMCEPGLVSTNLQSCS